MLLAVPRFCHVSLWKLSWSYIPNTTSYLEYFQAYYSVSLIRVVSTIIAVVAFGCYFLWLYLVQECHAAVTLLLSEACLFVIRMERTVLIFMLEKGAKSPFWL